MFKKSKNNKRIFQLAIKLFVINANRKRFVDLLRKMDAKFWSVHATAKITKIVKTSWWFVLTYCFIGLFLAVGVAIKPAINTARKLPLMCWTTDDNPIVVYCVIYAMQLYVLLQIYVTAGGFNLLYTAINARLCVQFKLLRDELENLDKTTSKLKKCIEHHRFLLEWVIVVIYKKTKTCCVFIFRCCNEISDIYSFVLLTKYVVFILTICVELYGVSELYVNAIKLKTANKNLCVF